MDDAATIATSGLTAEAIERMLQRTRAETASRRIDCWVEFGDGHYRLLLTLRMMNELEEKASRGMFSIYGSVARGRYEQAGIPFGFATEGVASLMDCREVVRLALVGGGIGVVDGAKVMITAPLARRLVETYLEDAPAIVTWDLAYAALAARVEGREMTDAEREHSSPKGPLVFPVAINEQAEAEA